MTPKPKDKPARKVKLTKLMKTVLRLMASGWELGSSTGSMDGPPFLQKGKVGHGGEATKTNWNTVGGLLNREMIVQHYKFPTATYSLTSLGHRASKRSSK